ncbi:hypothetical protein MRX96_003006 [Rhipicephalus microplus]
MVLTKGHAEDPREFYVDVSKYPHQPNTYTAAASAADTGVLTASAGAGGPQVGKTGVSCRIVLRGGDRGGDCVEVL